jgi:cytochrome b561
LWGKIGDAPDSSTVPVSSWFPALPGPLRPRADPTNPDVEERMPVSQYAGPARLLHWLMAILILLTVPAGLIMVRPGIDRGLQDMLFIYHKNVGVCLLLIVAARLVVRWRNPPPPLPSGLPLWQRRVARLTHLMLYGLLVVVPVAGYLRVRAGGFPIEGLDVLGLPALVPQSDALAEWAKSAHYWTGRIITAVIALHTGAALFHGLAKRDGVWSRMWPPLGGQWSPARGSRPFQDPES